MRARLDGVRRLLDRLRRRQRLPVQGTSTVTVHDLQTIPAEGIQYAVFLKKDLSKFRVPCEIGPRVVRLRAILSWDTPPPPANPNYVPVWGNREECLVQLDPGGSSGTSR